MSNKSPDLPIHVAIIMDGNGRWAQDRGLPRLAGHRAGMETLRRVVSSIAAHGIPYMTIFAFSTENWNRPYEEIEGLMAILRDAIAQETQSLHQENVRIRHIGRIDRLSPRLREAINRALELTRNNTGLTLGVAFDYGGRQEIINAYKRMVEDGVDAAGMTEEVLETYLYTHDFPDPDLIIRTSGEERLSNFLVWQSAYSEYYSVPNYWPDFGDADLDEALEAYRSRKRRFGGLDTTR